MIQHQKLILSPRECSQTHGPLMHKGGALKDFDRGVTLKTTFFFLANLDLTLFSVGLTYTFQGNRGGPQKIFWGLNESPKDNHAICFICISPPPQSTSEWSVNLTTTEFVILFEFKSLHFQHFAMHLKSPLITKIITELR